MLIWTQRDGSDGSAAPSIFLYEQRSAAFLQPCPEAMSPFRTNWTLSTELSLSTIDKKYTHVMD